MEKMKQQQQHLVFIPVPMISHIQPMVELAKNLHRRHQGFSSTFLVMPSLGPSTELTSVLSAAASSSFTPVHLPSLPPPPLPPTTRLPSLLVATFRLYTPLLESSLRTLIISSSPVTVILDSFLCFTGMLDCCLDLGVPPYLFYTTSASMLALGRHAPAFDPLVPTAGNTFDEEGLFPLPGFSSSPPLSTLPDIFAHGKDDVYELFIGAARHYNRAKGIIANTFLALQKDVLGALEEGLYALRGPPVHPVGPLLAVGVEKLEDVQKHGCMQWLDRQPPGTVVFLCFGTLGTFPRTQVEEIAAGLERSGQRFLWVASDGVPEGFEERTSERGLVWPSFAPQREILGHAAVGGFVTHCGWNSFLEAVWFGVPMAAWPLYAEQHWNAFEMVREIGVAVEVRAERRRGNWASAEEVERAVRELMGEGGEGVRRKVREMREEARRAVEKGGSSEVSLEMVVQELI